MILYFHTNLWPKCLFSAKHKYYYKHRTNHFHLHSGVHEPVMFCEKCAITDSLGYFLAKLSNVPVVPKVVYFVKSEI